MKGTKVQKPTDMMLIKLNCKNNDLAHFQFQHSDNKENLQTLGNCEGTAICKMNNLDYHSFFLTARLKNNFKKFKPFQTVRC